MSVTSPSPTRLWVWSRAAEIQWGLVGGLDDVGSGSFCSRTTGGPVLRAWRGSPSHRPLCE